MPEVLGEYLDRMVADDKASSDSDDEREGALLLSVIPAFATAADEDGQVVAWRGYPLILHRELAEPVVNAAELDIQTVHSYFSRRAGPATQQLIAPRPRTADT